VRCKGSDYRSSLAGWRTTPSETNTDWLGFQAQYAAATAPGAIPLDQQLGNLPLYAGYWWDNAIGLYHVRHRVYRPEWGRWLQRDPLGYAPGWNLYQYVNGMPWGSVDPMGLWGWGLPGQLMVWALQNEAGQGAIEVWERVTGDPYTEHAKWQMQMANMASANSARAARAGNDRLAQSIGMSFSLEMHNAQINEDFLTDGSFAAVDMITAAVPTGWAGGRVAGLISKTAAGKAVNAFGTKIFRIAGYVTDPIKGAIIRIGKYMTDAVKNVFNKVVKNDLTQISLT
jgi:RHS repeat-associated protein